MESNTTDIKARVLSRIHRGEVMMHSQVYFVLRLIALIVVALLSLGVSALLFTFLLYTIRVNLHAPMLLDPHIGLFFFNFFPWRLLLLDVLLIALAEWLLRGFRFAYRAPVLYLMFLLLAFALALGLFIDKAGFNDAMLWHAHRRDLPPPLNELYEQAHHPEMDTF